MFTGTLEDRLAIRELNDRYSDAVLRADAKDWGALWAEDAHWNLMGQEVDGREAIVKMWTGAMGGLEAVSFVCATCATDTRGMTGTGRVQTHEIMLTKDGATRVIGGRYEDVYVRKGGGWLYKSRIFSIVAEYQPAEG